MVCLRLARVRRSVVSLLLPASLALAAIAGLAACEDSAPGDGPEDIDSGMDPSTTQDAGGLDAAPDDDGPDDMGPDDMGAEDEDDGGDDPDSPDGSPDEDGDAGLPPLVPVVINFDELSHPTIVTTQYLPHAEFSAGAGHVLTTISGGSAGQSEPNYVCPAADDVVDCTVDMIVDFPAPVFGLRFHVVGVNDTGEVASLEVHVDGEPVATLPLVGQGTQHIPIEVDLGSFRGVTRVEMTDITDYIGVGWDDFSFQAPAR
jgi:hypothetical protein